MITLTDTATNRSTKVLSVVFSDTNGDDAIPTAASWTLTDEFGNVVNSRDSVYITPATTVTITLYGDDLDQEISPDRVITIEAEYDSTVYGSSLPSRQQATFSIGEWIEPEVTT